MFMSIMNSEEYKKLNKEKFAKNFEVYVRNYFDTNYKNAIIVKKVSLGNYFENIEQGLELFPSMSKVYLIFGNLSPDASIDTLMRWRFIDKIDNELYAGTNLNWQTNFYNELKIFFEFYRMPYVVPTFNLEHDRGYIF